MISRRGFLGKAAAVLGAAVATKAAAEPVQQFLGMGNCAECQQPHHSGLCKDQIQIKPKIRIAGVDKVERDINLIRKKLKAEVTHSGMLRGRHLATAEDVEARVRANMARAMADRMDHEMLHPNCRCAAAVKAEQHLVLRERDKVVFRATMEHDIAIRHDNTLSIISDVKA